MGLGCGGGGEGLYLGGYFRDIFRTDHSCPETVSQKLQPTPICKHISMMQPHRHLLTTSLFSSYLSRKLVLWLFVIMIICHPYTTGPTSALEITSHIKYYYIGRDSNVILNCEFVLASENWERIEIEWNFLSPQREQDDKIIIWYTGTMTYNNLYDPLKGRVYFTSPHPQNGIASIAITDVKLTDTGTYQCKVKHSTLNGKPEIQFKHIILSVMEKPSKPMCYIAGEAVVGKDLRLRCRSSEGSPPLKYRWSKTSRNQVLPQNAVIDTIQGDLYLDEITERDSGTYLCKVENLVGTDNCKFTLSVTSQLTLNYEHGTIAAVVVSVVVGIIIVIAVIYYCHRKKEEQFGNEILEDTFPPHKFRCTSDKVRAWTYESSQHSVQEPCSLEEEKSEGNGCIEPCVTTHHEKKELYSPLKRKPIESRKHGACDEKKKPREENVSEIDVCKADGEGHVKDEMSCGPGLNNS